jgi:hypothetical protein
MRHVPTLARGDPVFQLDDAEALRLPLGAGRRRLVLFLTALFHDAPPL